MVLQTCKTIHIKTWIINKRYSWTALWRKHHSSQGIKKQEWNVWDWLRTIWQNYFSSLKKKKKTKPQIFLFNTKTFHSVSQRMLLNQLISVSHEKEKEEKKQGRKERKKEEGKERKKKGREERYRFNFQKNCIWIINKTF